MRFILKNGFTSINLARVIAQCMLNEKVSDDYFLVTKHFLVENATVAERSKTKYIYLAYDAESIVGEYRGWDELKFLDSNRPELIITVSPNAYDFYKKQGFNTYYCKIGYDDLNHKEVKDKDLSVMAAWSMDNVRHSTFYYRYVLAKDISGFLESIKVKNYNISNGMAYTTMLRDYGRSLIGLNDVIRGVNERCFQIPVNGAVMLVNEQIRETDYPLKEGTHYLVYKSVVHLINQVDSLLKDREKTLKMGERAKAQALKHPQSMYVRKMVDKLGLR